MKFLFPFLVLTLASVTSFAQSLASTKYVCTRVEDGMDLTYVSTIVLKDAQLTEFNCTALNSSGPSPMCSGVGDFKVTGTPPLLTHGHITFHR